MPELLAALQRNESRRSKSFVLPPFQRMKVLPLAGFSGVVSPRIAPSRTLHSRGSPSQPVRSRPLKIDCIPAGSGGAVAGASSANKAQGAERAPNRIKLRIMIFSEKRTKERRHAFQNSV